jgi:hypothetical protein
MAFPYQWKMTRQFADRRAFSLRLFRIRCGSLTTTLGGSSPPLQFSLFGDLCGALRRQSPVAEIQFPFPSRGDWGFDTAKDGGSIEIQSS